MKTRPYRLYLWIKHPEAWHYYKSYATLEGAIESFNAVYAWWSKDDLPEECSIGRTAKIEGNIGIYYYEPPQLKKEGTI